MTAQPKHTRIPSREKPGTDVNGGFRSLGSIVADMILAVRARDAAAASAAHDELIRTERELAIWQTVRRFTR